MIKRIGFACKWIDNMEQIKIIDPKSDAKKYNTSTITLFWLNKQTRNNAIAKLRYLMHYNIESVYLLVKRVGSLNKDLRMVRLSSDILPFYNQENWFWFWRDLEIQLYCEKEFKKIGDLARSLDVRLSMHPGQFCVLASNNIDVVERSIKEFEYHVDIARWMGYGKKFQDFKINIHIAGKLGPNGIRKILGKLTPEARNTITIENEEMVHGLDDCLELADICPIVLDIHHHWIREGQYIDPIYDTRIMKIIDSWKGVRPVCHFSVSREDLLKEHCIYTKPDLDLLLKLGHKKQKLRAHSNFYWNMAVNKWALGFRENFDIMCESKAKNLASKLLYSLA